jgi:hypothetical protein
MTDQSHNIEYQKLQSNQRRASERKGKAALALDDAKSSPDAQTRRGQRIVRHAAKSHKKAAISEANHSAALLEYVLPPATASVSSRARL